jgi:mono/diheme cytochrome c family protein
MNTTRLRFRFGAVLGLALGVLCFRGSAADSESAVFKRFDKNGDGRVTKDELPAAKVFARYDRDGDGVITYEEYLFGSLPGKLPGLEQIDSTFRSLDRDGDGKLSHEEAGGQKWFAALDRNGDGVVDSQEVGFLKTAVQNRPPGAKDSPAERTNPGAAPAFKPGAQGPLALGGHESGVGRMVDNLALTDLDGKTRTLGELASHSGCVLAFTSATCPVSKRYLPSLKALETELSSAGIPMILVNPFPSESPESIREQTGEHRFKSPYVRDTERAISKALGARSTTEVFLLDPVRTVVYRGALDDQYGPDYSRPEARQHFLRDALKARAAGIVPSVPATTAPGCELDLPDDLPTDGKSRAPGRVTYYRDIARILQQHCIRCHHQGGIGPFSLEDLESVTDRTGAIRRVVERGQMPPWFASEAVPSQPSPWANDCSLPPRDKADLLAWLSSRERPLGNPADAPIRVRYASEWTIGVPDLVIPLSRSYEIKAQGTMPYVVDVVQTELTEAKWVSAYEIIPSARDVVHHVIVDVYEPGASVKDREEGVGGYWAAYVPGNTACVYPKGFARRIPAGAKVKFQIHYTPSGKRTEERLGMGLVFSREAPEYELRTISLANRGISIPPGAPAHAETFSKTVPFDLPVTAFLAHMHLRGSAFKYEVRYPDGAAETLLDIPHYDFNWQLRYARKETKWIPKGSTMTVTAVYNNSAENKANPDPKKWVKWGSQTFDEMMIGYLEYFVPVSGPRIGAR